MKFVILIHPNKKGVYFPLIAEDGTLMIFPTSEAASEAAQRTLFGSHGLYDVYDL